MSDNEDVSALLDPVVSSRDSKLVLELKKQRQLTSNEKYYLLTHHFKPNSAYQFHSFSVVSRSIPFSTVGSPAIMVLSIPS